jgi:chromosome segregation ATPase
MTNNSTASDSLPSGSEIIFDADYGISEEEQREILAKINSIAESNRRSLSKGAASTDGGTGKRPRFKAKKSGRLFPVVVNAVAVAALAGGLFALWFFHGKTDARVREGTRVYNSIERALIDEIRRDTASRLEAKENEISLIASRLEEIDIELQGLQSSNQNLSAEQIAAQNRLLALQNDYRAEMEGLQNDRSRILEEARVREASLQAQLESRTRELAAVAEQSAAAIGQAQGEIERLSWEQSQAATVEAQMGAFFANLNTQVYESRFDEAAETVQAMRTFLNTPAFQGLRSIQARKELYTQAIHSFETMIDEVRRFQAAGLRPPDRNAERSLAALQEQNARLEQDLEEKDRTIAAFSSGESGLTRRVDELERTIRDLRTANEASSSEKDSRIASLEADRDLQAGNAEAAQRAADTLRGDLDARTNRLNRIQEVVRGRAIEDMTIGELNDSLSRIQEALQSP